MKIAFLNSKSGTTLIELMIALLIIAMIVLAGGMFFFRGRINTVREARRRAAVLVAEERLEALKAANAHWEEFAHDPYDPSFDPDLRYYITYHLGTDTWEWDQPAVSAGDPPDSARETKIVDNNTEAEMVTEAKWKDDDGGPIPDDYLRITVALEWMEGTTNNLVTLTTLIAER